MDEPIFIKEKQSSSWQKYILPIAAATLVVVGLAGILISVANQSNSSATSADQETVAISEQSSQDEIDTEKESINDPNNNVDEQNVEEPPADTQNEDENPNSGISPVYAPPSDESKINVYFPKSPETKNNSDFLVAVLRDKPTESTIATILTQILRGPESSEKAQGFYFTWSFSGGSNCDSKTTFKYEIKSGKLFLTMCKQFSGSDASLYRKSVEKTLTVAAVANSVAVLDYEGNCLGYENATVCK